MPHISLSLYRGRSEAELKAMCRNLQQCLVDAAGYNLEDISVSIEEMEPNSFISEVEKKTKSERIVIPSDYMK